MSKAMILFMIVISAIGIVTVVTIISILAHAIYIGGYNF